MKRRIIHDPNGIPEEMFMQQFPHHEDYEREEYADGGAADGEDAGVPIVAAGGEYVLHPDQVRMAGGGDLNHGHSVLDEFVERMRGELVKTLKKLPGPRRD